MNCDRKTRQLPMMATTMLFVLLAFFALGANQVKAAFSGGTGAEGDPYIIATETDMTDLAVSVYSGTTYANKFFKIADEVETIELTYDPNIQSPWQSVGYRNNNPFKGNFDGGGKEIRINSTVTSTAHARDVLGLFACIGEGGTVENVRVTGAYSAQGATVVGIAGINQGTIKNCVIEAELTNLARVGGIADTNTGMITGCSVLAGASMSSTIDGMNGAGSAAGVCVENKGTITQCMNAGTVSTSVIATSQNAEFFRAGGIVAINGSGTETGTVKECFNTGKITSISNEGGIVGLNNSQGVVQNCYNTGLIKAGGTNSINIAGIVGNNHGLVTICYSTGDIDTAYNTNVGADNKGGIVGFNRTAATTSNCVALGQNVICKQSITNVRVVGHNVNGFMVSNRARADLKVNGNIVNTSNAKGVEGETVSIGALQNAVFTGFSSSVWVFPTTTTLEIGGDLPILRNFAETVAQAPKLPPVAVPTIDSVSADPDSLPDNGSLKSTITVTGTDLPESMIVTAFEGATETEITGTTNDSGEVELTFPENTTNQDKTYTVKVKLSDSGDWDAETATVTVKKAEPQIDSVTANPTTLPTSTGSRLSTITVTGSNLPQRMRVTAFEGDMATDVTGTTNARGTVSLAFPENTTSSDKTYTIKVKLTDNESTPWDNETATVTVTGKKVELSSIAVTNAPTKTVYTEGESFEAAGMVVTATYSDNTTKAVTTYTYEPSGALSTTDDKVTISYTEDGVTKTAEQAITVNPTPTEPTIIVSRSEANFGDREIDTDSDPIDIAVSGFQLTGEITYAVSGDSAFTVTESNWDPATGGSLQVVFSPTAEADYNGTITFSSTGAENRITTLSGTGVAQPEPDPVITTDLPAEVKPAAGEASTTLTIAADYADNYQWYKDGVALEGETGATLTIVKEGGDGDYYVIVTGTNGNTVTSSTANVQWITGKGSVTVSVENGQGTPALQVDEEALKKAVLTAEEWAELEWNPDLNIDIIVLLNIGEEDGLTQQYAQAKGYTVGAYYSIEILKVRTENGLVISREKLSQLNNPVTFTMDIPAALQGTNHAFVMLHNHDNEVTVLGNADGGAATISFETDTFSPYTLAYKSGSTPVPGPVTGDDSNVGGLLTMLALSLVLMGVCGLRRQRNKA